MLPVLCLVAATAFPDIPRIDLTCELKPADAQMSVKCTLAVPAKWIKTGKLQFQLADQMSVPSVRETLTGKELIPKKETQDDHDVTFSVPVSATDKGVSLEFSYASAAPKGFVYLLSDQECLAGGYNTLWFPAVGDARRMLGTFRFRTPSDYLVKASGRAISSTVDGAIRTSEFRIEEPIVPTFAAARFHVVDIPGKVPVHMYFLSDRDGAQVYADGCSKILPILEKEFGPYPFPDFSIIETPSPVSSNELGFSGASFEGFMFADSESVDAGFNLAYFGHEMSHQWWGNFVQVDGTKGESMCSEGLAQYGSLQVVKQIDGADLAKKYRLSGYPGYSPWQCMSGALAIRDTGNEVPLSTPSSGRSRLMHELPDTKGFLAWETLARVMGNNGFRDTLRQVTKEYAWGAVSWEQFWETLQSHTKVDLRPYRAQWFEQTGIPTVWTEWRQDAGRLSITLKQNEPAYRLQMPLLVRYKDGSQSVRGVEFSTTSHEIVIDHAKPLMSVELDPDHETLHSTPQLDAWSMATKDYAQTEYVNRLVAQPVDARKVLEDALNRLPSPDPHGVEFVVRYKLGEIYRSGGELPQAKEQLEKALSCAVRRDDLVPMAFLRLARVYDAMGNKAEVRRCLESMVASESLLKYPSGALLRARQLFPDSKL